MCFTLNTLEASAQVLQAFLIAASWKPSFSRFALLFVEVRGIPEMALTQGYSCS